MSSAEGSIGTWGSEIMAIKSKTGVNTADNWQKNWPDIDGAHKNFDKKHTPHAKVLENGDLQIIIPGRGLSRAGVKGHYIQYLFVRDEVNRLRYAIKFNPDDEVFPWTVKAAHLKGAWIVLHARRESFLSRSVPLCVCVVGCWTSRAVFVRHRMVICTCRSEDSDAVRNRRHPRHLGRP